MLRKLQRVYQLRCTWSRTSIVPRRFFADVNDLNRIKFEEDFSSSHIETTRFQKFLLAVGSAAVSLLDPMRADMIAVMGETAGDTAIKYMLQKMQSDNEGQEILRNRPRINSRTVDLEKLRQMPDGTLGRTYIKFLDSNKVTPDSRLPVQFVDDIELAYVIQRYREVHDLFHTILGMPTNMLGEVTVKWVEAIQTRLPMCVGGALFGPLRLYPKQRQKYVKYYLPWAIETGTNCKFLMNVFYEHRWEQPIKELHKELHIKALQVPKS
ncbi:Ubiquinone biosynthesis protein COQ4-like protein, mitochondrial [Cryptotermes secundus]|uniref:Ubiquinone biosynthesis protein COQ4 homolog, mitochondrial n=3 Tax=Cryptotermes secundus TaxID=105785 RepID=A0A2J7QK90_9NEOP|nr:ubiquinone biosynthesis protein COQ4 homolog, mitochondrial isoform X4 [Cryptotermes secundus]PNF29001.1 Ubiquinone biosynthesis protein COQ4-like protein, mitochondrial [Cryptotermes secundus]